MEQTEIENKEYLKRFNKIYIWFASFSDDLLFYVAISTLFYTMVKGFSVQEIVFLTTISSIISLILRIPLIKLMQKIGSTISVRIGTGLFLIASILITFGNSYFIIIIAECLYAIGKVFKNMVSVILKHNLIYQKLEDKFIVIKNKASGLYAILTAIVAFAAGFLFSINNYLPMYLCIFFCFMCFILSFSIKEVLTTNKNSIEEKEQVKFNFSKIILLTFITYGLFYGLIEIGQKNGQLFVQYELLKIYSAEQTAIYLSIIVAISRVVRVFSNISFNKVYSKCKDSVTTYLGIILFSAFLFMSVAYFINISPIFKFTIMSIGYFCILMARDPFNIYIQDMALKNTEMKEHQLVIAYLEFSRKLGATILSLLVSALLVKIDMIYVMISFTILSLLEIYIILKLYNLMKKKIDLENSNRFIQYKFA